MASSKHRSVRPSAVIVKPIICGCQAGSVYWTTNGLTERPLRLLMLLLLQRKTLPKIGSVDIDTRRRTLCLDVLSNPVPRRACAKEAAAHPFPFPVLSCSFFVRLPFHCLVRLYCSSSTDQLRVMRAVAYRAISTKFSGLRENGLVRSNQIPPLAVSSQCKKDCVRK